ncbi:MAG: cupin domain-containing protein [Proteobacteria bacterium]|nr:cupin domain-containing protein [Pseudomonadota bacterium]
MTIDIGNLFESLPEDISKEVFSEIIQGENIRIERIISKGHSSPEAGWYDQDDNEWVIVLKGEAKLSFENNDDVHLVSGSHLNIPAHTKHKVTWTKPNTETIWLAVHYK